MNYNLSYGNYQPGDANAMIAAMPPTRPSGSYSGIISEAANSGGDAAGMIPNPYAQAASVGLKAVGTAADIWGMYEQKKQAEKNYQLVKEAYDEQMRRAEEQDKIAAEQLAMQNMMTGAQYANQQRATGRNVYGSYNRMIGR